jgi:hypothetical protein
MLALHLIQNCMVYVNTLMIQKVLAQPHWQGKLTPRDYAALTPLIWEHVNPYGRFDLDMNSRLALLWSIWRLVTRVLGLPLVSTVQDESIREVMREYTIEGSMG